MRSVLHQPLVFEQIHGCHVVRRKREAKITLSANPGSHISFEIRFHFTTECRTFLRMWPIGDSWRGVDDRRILQAVAPDDWRCDAFDGVRVHCGLDS